MTRYPGALWLAPEPKDVFRAITAALVDAEAAVRAQLPLSSRAERALLIEQVEPPHWRAGDVFAR